MRILSLILALSVVSCKPKTFHVFTIAPETYPYVMDFYADANARGVFPQRHDLMVTFVAKLPLPVAARCRLARGANAVPQVLISREFWGIADGVTRKKTIYHELGHCLLGRIHNDEINSHGEPRSIMYHDIDVDDYFKKHYNEYLDELFFRGRGPE